jgi:hypothetical protein
MEVIASSIKNINLNSKFVRFNTPKGGVVVDIVKLMRSEGDDAYFNASSVAKMFADTPRKAIILLQQYNRRKQTIAYKKALERHFYRINNIETSQNSNNNNKLQEQKIEIKRRGYRGDNSWKNGTWFHKDLALDFFRYLDADFAVACDQLIKSVIKEITVLKIDRTKTKILFHPLTDTIKDIYIPAQKSEAKVKWAYQSLADMCNLWAIGMTSRKFKTENNIEPKHDESIRDYMNDSSLERIKQAEKHLHGLMVYGGITDYDELKERLFKLK